ncbi:MAG: Holliday junction branch migration protein RuvA [Spirochaetota bacterium]
MFNSIRGLLCEKRLDSICVETGGIEWELFVPTRSLPDFGGLGSETRVFTWLHHYEDGMRLFGFPTKEERVVFLELMKVEGIGPKQALRVLSGIDPSALDAALESEDLAALQRIPGVGPKLAQKMLLALKGKLVLTPEMASDPRRPVTAWGDVVKALADMGFDRKEAERVVAEKSQGLALRGTGGTNVGKETEKEIFRLSLLELSTGA